MTNNSAMVVFEGDFLHSRENADGRDERSHFVAPATFAALEKHFLDENNGHADFATSISKKGYWMTLSIKNYAWVVATSDGTVLEILPKIGRGWAKHGKQGKAESARRAFLKMLRTNRGKMGKGFLDAWQEMGKLPLLEAFVHAFLDEVDSILVKGLRREYVTVQENQPFVRGKLLVGENLRKNAVRKNAFYVSHDEFSHDVAANRVIRSALSEVGKMRVSSRAAVRARKAACAFEDVPESADWRKDAAAAKIQNRLSAHYAPVLAWASRILEGKSPSGTSGTEVTLSLLYPMERLFESYVAKSLARQEPGWDISTQDSGLFLVEDHDGKKKFSLRPDIVAYKKWSPSPIIFDTKWKLVDSSDGKNNYGISQSDMYQLFAYAKKYRGCTELYLVYPKHEGFHSNMIKPFLYETGEAVIALRAVCFDLEHESWEFL